VWSKDETKQIAQSEHGDKQPGLDCPANYSVDYCIGAAEACFGVHKNENEDGCRGYSSRTVHPAGKKGPTRYEQINNTKKSQSA
jgi:hypothetical protein